MLLSGSRISQLALFLSFSTFLTPLSPATLNDPPAQALQSSLAPTSQQQDQLRDLVARVLHHADKAGCKKGTCTILVANFTGSSGSTSILGMQLADAVSKELASQQHAIKIIDRSRLQSFLEEQRIPADLLNTERAIRWLGKELGTTTVLRGTTEYRGGPLRVQMSLLSSVKDKAGPVEEFALPDSDTKSDLTPFEPFPKTLSSPSSSSAIPLIRVAGKDGVGAPACSYCPSPMYTEPAREAKFTGTVILQLTISEQGRTVDARVVRGLPFGLNQSAIRTVGDWQFKPAMRNGEPVTCMVMMEATFRLY
jgi:TonB family protein